jgi:hypothetical protein
MMLRGNDTKILRAGSGEVLRCDFIYNSGLYTYREIDYLIKVLNYIPVTSASEFVNINSASINLMGLGSSWEGDYTTGANKRYIQLNDIDLSTNTNFTTNTFTGIYDGNLLNIDNVTLSSTPTLFNLTGASGDRTLRNIKINGTVTTNAANLGLLAGIVNAGYLIEDCEASGTVTTSSTLNQTGGMVTRNNGTMKRCVSHVDVTKSSGLYIGSLAGYNNGLMQNCYATGSVSGGSDVGGLVGRVFSSGIIINCYSIGAVSGTNTGGLVGTDGGGTVTNSYYDSTASGQSDTGKGVAKTTTEMQNGTIPDSTIYVNWARSIWNENESNEYPSLKTTFIKSLQNIIPKPFNYQP